MSEDPDFEMEVVENDKLDELDANSASSSEQRPRSEAEGEMTTNSDRGEGITERDGAVAPGHTDSNWREDSEGKGASSRLSNLPADWPVNQIREVAKVVGGSTPSTDNEEYWGGSIPWATPTDITGLCGTTITRTEDMITEEGLDSASTHVLPAYSVLMTSRATIGACAINTVPMTTNQGFQSLVPGDKLNTWYLLYRMLHEAPYLESLGAGSTFSEISKRVVEKVDIPVSPLPEQRKIASVLYAVDQAIQKTEEIIEQAKRVKQGFTEDIWTYGLRAFHESDELAKEERYQETTVGRFPSKWEIVNLDSITERVTDGSHQAVETLPDDEEGIPFLYVSCIRDGQIRWDKASSISEEVYKDISTGKEPESGVILYTAVGSYGHAVLLEDDKRLSFQRHIAYIRPDFSQVDPGFLAHWLDGKRAKKYASRVAQGNAQKTVTLHDLSRYPIPLPEREIQERIAVTLDQFDEWIRTEKKMENRLKRLKKGLMQDLLTGEVRTADRAIEVLEEVRVHG